MAPIFFHWSQDIRIPKWLEKSWPQHLTNKLLTDIEYVFDTYLLSLSSVSCPAMSENLKLIIYGRRFRLPCIATGHVSSFALGSRGILSRLRECNQSFAKIIELTLLKDGNAELFLGAKSFPSLKTFQNFASRKMERDILLPRKGMSHIVDRYRQELPKGERIILSLCVFSCECRHTKLFKCTGLQWFSLSLLDIPFPGEDRVT